MTTQMAARGFRPVRMLAVVCAIGLAWLAARQAALGHWQAREPALAMAFAPAGGAALTNLAQARIVAAAGAVDTEARELIARSMRSAPGSAAPVMLAGLAASADGDDARARALMTIARNRDPRADIVRYWLLDHHIRRGDYRAALAEVGPAMRLRPGTRELILALVAALLADPRGADAVHAALATDPDWRGDFFAVRAGTGTDPLALLALLSRLPRARNPIAADTEQRAVLRAAVEQRHYAAAYRAWRSFLPAVRRRASAMPYDPNFEGLPGPLPFNWTTGDNAAGEASITPAPDLPEAGAMTLAFHGATPAVLTEQLVLAAPGPATLSLRSRMTGADPVGRIVARVRCAQNDMLLAEMPLATVGGPIQLYAASFAVPPRCDAVRLQFVGEPGERFGEVRIQVTGVDLRTGRSPA
ncbi:hypothetical protein [Sphingomonas qomolangmaensis]|uniref:Tetratricopeptide repeat protein n=1 Tax=Sphingomonas qomolangmaensis TaxID=2918765 RepID=A0ABY5L9D5_9SPHN|nr:hypothetical protein [Sphingomonas qomolangmaensis]UUL82472.1 hypothetical protein NMP03_15085 [Sphingomonas qomolangmaensis]